MTDNRQGCQVGRLGVCSVKRCVSHGVAWVSQTRFFHAVFFETRHTDNIAACARLTIRIERVCKTAVLNESLRVVLWKPTVQHRKIFCDRGRLHSRAGRARPPATCRLGVARGVFVAAAVRAGRGVPARCPA